MKAKFLILLAAGLLATSAVPSAARPYSGPRCHLVGPGVVLKMSQYQQPDGSYASVSDFVRDVNGTPCGLDCPAPSRVIWVSGPSYVCSGF